MSIELALWKTGGRGSESRGIERMSDDAAAVTAEGLEGLFSVLSRVGGPGESDQERVDQLAALER